MDNGPIHIGDCFVFANDEGGTHLHIIVAEDHKDPYGHVMLVYLTSSRIFDETVKLQPGDHTFITKLSWPKYNNIQIILRSELHEKIKQRYEPLPPDILEKIQQGLLKSKRTPRRMKDTYNDWHLSRL